MATDPNFKIRVAHAWAHAQTTEVLIINAVKAVTEKGFGPEQIKALLSEVAIRLDGCDEAYKAYRKALDDRKHGGVAAGTMTDAVGAALKHIDLTPRTPMESSVKPDLTSSDRT